MKDRQYKSFQRSMQTGIDCMWRKGNKYIKVKIKELHEYNAMVIDETTNTWHMAGKVDLYPLDF
jgi:hypothetical protein